MLQLTLLNAEGGFREGAEKARREKKGIKRECDKQKKAIEDIEKAKATTDKRLAALRTRQMWACVSMRNDHIINAIERDFAQRQKTLARDVYHNDVYDGSVDVIPVSATAFRDILKDREPMGFPTLAHTGIPRLRRWLEDAMLEQREDHLDTLLHALQRLFSTIQRWSNTNLGHQAIVFSREAVEELLARTHTKFSMVRTIPCLSCVWQDQSVLTQSHHRNSRRSSAGVRMRSSYSILSNKSASEARRVSMWLAQSSLAGR